MTVQSLDAAVRTEDVPRLRTGSHRRRDAGSRSSTQDRIPRDLSTVDDAENPNQAAAAHRFLYPQGELAERTSAYAAQRRAREAIPRQHLPHRRLLLTASASGLPLPRLARICRDTRCRQLWPCEPLVSHLRYLYADAQARLEMLSTRRARARAARRNPAAVSHRAFVARHRFRSVTARIDGLSGPWERLGDRLTRVPGTGRALACALLAIAVLSLHEAHTPPLPGERPAVTREDPGVSHYGVIVPGAGGTA